MRFLAFLLITILAAACETQLRLARDQEFGGFAVSKEGMLTDERPRVIGDNVGIATMVGDRACLMIGRGDFRVGEKVTILTNVWYPPVEIVGATILRRASKNCWEGGDFDGESFERRFYYELNLDKPRTDPIIVDFAAVVSPSRAKIRYRAILIDVDGDGHAEFFRSCSGNESIHYSIWKGRPLKGTKIWSAYLDLNYDTVPTCTRKDYEY